jgi:hypothetical protein
VNPGAPSKLIAAIFALAAFVVAVLAGLGAGNPASRVLTVALVSLALCYALGSVVGAIGQWVITEHVRSRARAADAVNTEPAGAKSAPS